jgi:trypsin
MSKVGALTAAVLAALVFTGSIPAQTGDAQLDNNRHPNAGALLAKRADTSLFVACSGTLVSKQVFLTAGHCAEFLFSLGQHDAFVTFDPNFGLDPGHDIFSTPFHGTVIENPNFHVPFQNDTAIVLLDKAVAGITPAKLAPLGYLDGLKDAHLLGSATFTNVGYGSTEQMVVPGTGPVFGFDGLRKFTISGFYALTPEYLHLNQSLAQGLAGSCLGDSGGPTFLGSLLVAISSAGDAPCYNLGVNQRVDVRSTMDFLAPFLR